MTNNKLSPSQLALRLRFLPPSSPSSRYSLDADLAALLASPPSPARLMASPLAYLVADTPLAFPPSSSPSSSSSSPSSPSSASLRQRLGRVLATKMALELCVLLLTAIAATVLLLKSALVFPLVDGDSVHYDAPLAIVDYVIPGVTTVIAPGIALHLLYRRARVADIMVQRLLPLVTPIAAASAVVYFLVFANHLVLSRSLLVLYFALYLGGIGLVSRTVQQRTGDPVVRGFALPQVVSVITLAVYSILLPFAWRAMDNDVQRAVFRLVVHPIVMETAMLVIRFGSRTAALSHPFRAHIALLPIQLLSSLYGRFLVAATDNSTTTIIIAVILAVEEVVLRLSVGARDRFLARLFFGSSQEAQDRFRTLRSIRLRADLVAQDQICEGVGILTSSIAVLIFRVSISGSELTASRVLTDMAIQYLLEFVVDIVVMEAEERMNVPVVAAWRTRFGNEKNDAVRYIVWVAFFLLLAVTYFVSSFFHPVWGFVSLQSA